MQATNATERLRRPAWWMGVILLLLVLTQGCKKSGDAPQARLAFRSDVKTKLVTTDDPHCPSPEKVESPAPSETVYPIAEAYRAALMPDGEKARERFKEQFIQRKDSSFLFKHQWPRLRKHVRKYVRDPDNFSFEVCRRQKKDEKSIKLFIRSHDPAKTHPPITVEKVDSGWKIAFFTY
jgi:hypothetical protein